MHELKLAVEKHSKLILDAERYIWAHPETGYKEYETSAYMEKIFTDLGYALEKPSDITGFVTTLDTGKEGPTVLILGELDSIICPEHPECNKETGAVHSCGHNAQCAALIGIAAALKEPGILDKFCGKIKLCAVPAEELLEIEYRANLREKGVIRYFGGKPEYLARGYFDDVDLAFMVHTSSKFSVRGGSVGCLAKKITYKGKASHAGGSPWNGINALYAASCGLNAVNAIRETFQEKDIIRVHPIITKGGAMVNAIPGEATLESYIRGESFEAMIRENKKVNRAFIGAALSLGANIDVTDFAGYAPLKNCEDLMLISKEAANTILPEEEFSYSTAIGSGSTDMGDLSSVMPVVHPYAAGAKGTSHGSEYYIVDPVKACVKSAQMQLAMLYILLKDNAKRAKEIVANYKAPYTIKEYLDFMESLNRSGDRIEYTEDEVKVSL
ncbi:MAG: amidohydrolase [Clostridia bacterium]|nr:amidohydrolase [Clostridia bacterium]MBO7288770.1 amidohydrolase [Clostridia bacterium]